jgi:hypothetical protein
LFINDTLSYSFQPNTRSNSWLLLPIDTDEKEKNEIRKKKQGIDEEKKIVNKDTFAKNPTDRSTKTRENISIFEHIYLI